MKSNVPLVIVGLILIGAGLIWWYRQDSRHSLAPASNSGRSTKTTSGPSDEANEGGPTNDPLSLTSFAARQFTGHDFKVGRVLDENSAYTRYYIMYKSGELAISGIMNVPKGTGPFPVLILNHGFIDPSIYTNGRGLKREQDYLARHGYVVLHSDYRNHADSDDDPEVDRRFRQAYAEDVINAIKALEAANLPYVDSTRVGMLGHSMGGGIAWVIAVTQPDLVDAFVQFAPVSADARDNFEKWTKSRPLVARAIVKDHGAPAENPEFWDQVSPMTFFKNVTVPILIHHGTADESVPLTWSQRSTTQLQELSKDIVLHTYPGEPHEFAAAWSTVMARTTTFFDEHVKK